MGKVKYDLHVSLQPQINKGAMAHYWNITISTDDGTFTIADGWRPSVYSAIDAAHMEVRKRGLVK
jgi:hypothetical protein